jgi:alpha-2-macroglobulin
VQQAELLRLFIAQKASPSLIDQVLNGLLDLRDTQTKGTWPGTYANAQAIRAVLAYAQLQPEPANFTAKVSLGNRPVTSQTFRGNQTSEGRIFLPMDQLPQGRNPLKFVAQGPAGMLHYFAALRYQPTGTSPGRMSGLRVSRELRLVNQPEPLARLSLTAANQPITVKPGDVLDIGLEVIADHAVNHLVINDPLPAGLEAVDSQFQTTTAYFQPLQDSWEIDYQTIYKDRISAYADRLEPGVYTLHYLVRAVTPGTFTWPGAKAHLQFAPEEFGRTSAATLVVK